jgi:hypothetical protein
VRKQLERQVAKTANEIGYENFRLKDVDTDMRRSLQDRLQGIEKQTILLRNAVHRSITTGIVSIRRFKPGSLFRLEDMDNVYAEVPATSKDITVATITLGLSMKVADTQQGQWLLKPNVILENILNEL